MLEIEVQLPQKITTNVYYNAHHHARTPIKHDYYLAVKDAAKSKGKIKDYPINATYCFYLTGRAVDWVNLSAMAKMLEDGLVREGVIEDDAPKFVSQGMLIYNKSKRKYDYCVIELG